jgi:four helix bundle protein
LALDYIDAIYGLAQKLPRSEDFNLKSQITRSATSIALNIAEGSTSQSDAEQGRFLGMALRSLIETVACKDIIARRKYVTAQELTALSELESKLFAKTQAFKKFLRQSTLRRADCYGGHPSSVIGRIPDLRQV